MNDDLFDTGLKVRKAVLGDAFVEKSLASADDFSMPMQRLVTEYCWGAVWGREELPLKIRSMLKEFRMQDGVQVSGYFVTRNDFYATIDQIRQ